MKIQITTMVRSHGLRDRVYMAWFKLRARKKWGPAIRGAWNELFRAYSDSEVGEVDYGGGFPLDKLDRLVHAHLLHCDEKLLDLVGRAVVTRREDQIDSAHLTSADIRLYDHIVSERRRLQRLFSR